MNPKEMTPEDVHQTFCRGYLGYKQGNTIEPVFVRDAGSDERGTYMVLRGENGDNIEAYLDDPNLVYQIPDSQMFLSSGMRFFKRNANRQWRRSIHPNNCEFLKYRVVDGDIETGSVDWGYQEVRDLYNGTGKARSKLLSRRLGEVVSKHGHWLVYMGEVVSDRRLRLSKRWKYLQDYVNNLGVHE